MPAQVEGDVQATGEAVGGEFGEQPVGVREHLARAGPGGGVGADGRAHLPHQSGGGHVVPLHVADDGGDLGVAEPDQVVEVAADVHARGGRHISGRHVQAGQVGECARQQARLQALGELVLDVVETGALERLRDQPGEGDQ